MDVTLRIPSSQYTFDKDGLLIKVALTDCYIQRVEPEKLRRCILQLLHYTTLTNPRGEKGMCDTLRGDFHWMMMGNDVCLFVEDSNDCRNRGAGHKHQ